MITGNIRFRAGWRGKLILQVEERTTNEGAPEFLVWRDAKVEDFATLKVTGFSPSSHPTTEKPPNTLMAAIRKVD